MSKITKVVATRSFEQAIKRLKKDHKTDACKEIYKTVKSLLNLEITKQKSNHPLKNSEGHFDIHLSGGKLILLYRYDTSDTNETILILGLRLQDVVDHDQLSSYDSKKYRAPSRDYDPESIKSSTMFETFRAWYDSLSDDDQYAVDDFADTENIPFYEEASDSDLSFLMDHFAESHRVYGRQEYGGAYDIDPYQYFTKEELVEFAQYLVDRVNRINVYPETGLFDISNVDMNDDVLTVELESDEGYGLGARQRIDMRRIKKPSDLYKYANFYLQKFSESLDEDWGNAVDAATNSCGISANPGV